MRTAPSDLPHPASRSSRCESDDRLTGCLNHNANLPVAAVQSLNTGRVGDRVLISDVVRDLNGERLDFRYFLRIEGEPTRGRGQFS